MRRGWADLQSCSDFVAASIDDANAGFARVRDHKPIAVGAERKEVRVDAHRNRGDHTPVLTIPYRQSIGGKIGDVSVAPIRTNHRKMRPSPGWYRCDDLMTSDIDDR